MDKAFREFLEIPAAPVYERPFLQLPLPVPPPDYLETPENKKEPFVINYEEEENRRVVVLEL